MDFFRKLMTNLQSRPGWSVQKQDDGIDIPPRLETTISKMQHLIKLSQRDPQAIIPLIQIGEQIVEQLQPNETPLLYAAINNDLGLAYRQLLTGDREANLVQAITYYLEALRFWTPEADPSGYATTQNNLGLAYSKLLTRNRAENLAQAIVCYQEALRFWTPEANPPGYALVQNNLGSAYYHLPLGDRATNLTQAIACYQQALRFRTPEAAPLDYATTQNNLGSAYSALPTGDYNTNLTRAIACYQQTLRFWTPEDAPLNYAAVQNNLGSAYYGLLAGDRSANLTQAIACYQQALRFWTPEAAPLDYAAVQNNLGTVYSELPTGNHTTNLTQAIACYQQALRFWTPETSPLDYATAQNNLGTAYSALPTGDHNANLTQAIACYREALRFRTSEAAPLDYATTQNNLGTAYHRLLTGDRAANLTKAIECYQQALRFRTSEAAPLDYAATQSNLGLAYYYLPIGNHTVNLTRAITCYQEALRFHTPEAEPLGYASTQNNLGLAYSEWLIGDHSVNLTQAIECYQQALRFRTPEAAPLDYATTQSNLGSAYSELSVGIRATNLTRAIACYKEALRFHTPEAEPFECRSTASSLADLYFAQERWDLALHFYRIAMDVGELLYRVGLSTESKASEVTENASFYPRAAFAAARCGQIAEALLILEQGKTRLLIDALHLRVHRPPQVSDEAWRAFEQAVTAVRAEQAKKTVTGVEVRRDLIQIYETHVQASQAANIALNTAIDLIRSYAPNFLKTLDLSTIQAQVQDKHTALIAFCITEQGSMGFIVSQCSQDAVHMVEIPAFSQTDLRRLFAEWDVDGQLIGGWLRAYGHYLVDPMNAEEVWKDAITQVLAELGEHLLTPLLSVLPATIKHIILLPSAELFLFSLHAAPLSGSDSKLLCDYYQVSYAPSIEVLASARARNKLEVEPALYAVINPENDRNLPFTAIEGAAIAQLFTQCTIDSGQVAVKERVLTGVRGQTYVHFSCHGGYNWNAPSASGLSLANDYLTLDDLQQREVDLSAARLVTLSACETGITDIMQGSPAEYVGIPAGFLLAGASCVVCSLWSVPDLSTALLMERFYRNHLVENFDFAAALQEAQLWIREISIGEVAAHVTQWYQEPIQRGKAKESLLVQMRHYQYLAKQHPTLHPFANPYYWAAFTVNGI